MRFSEIVKKYEDDYRGKFIDDEGNIFKCTEDGIQWSDDGEIVCCYSGMLKDDTYELIKEPKKVTFEEAFTNPEYKNEFLKPECDSSLGKNTIKNWYNYFTVFSYKAPELIKSMWIIEEE